MSYDYKNGSRICKYIKIDGESSFFILINVRSVATTDTPIGPKRGH